MSSWARLDECTQARHRGNVTAWAAAVFLAAAACGLACYDVPRRPSVETEFFVVHYREDRPPTLEELEALDFHFRLVGLEIFSVPLSATPIHIHLYRDQDDLADNSPCGSRMEACYRHYENRVHSAPAFDYLHHELVHAYSDARCGRSISLLDEGLAEALTATTHEAIDNATYLGGTPVSGPSSRGSPSSPRASPSVASSARASARTPWREPSSPGSSPGTVSMR